MKFVVDQQLPPALAAWLKAKGHDAEHVHAIGLGAVDDRAIWDHVVTHAAVIVTKDIDFAERRQRATAGPSVVWLRIRNSSTSHLLTWIDARWDQVEARLAADDVLVEVR